MIHVVMIIFTVFMSFLTSIAFYYELDVSAAIFILMYFFWVIGLAWEKNIEEKEGG